MSFNLVKKGVLRTFMEKIFNKVLICDGNYLACRALHIPEIFNLRSPDGERSGLVFAALRMINKEMKECGDYFPIFVFDSGLSPRRVKADPFYKHADERADASKQVLTPEESDIDFITQLRQQISKLIEVLKYIGIPSIKIQSYEGDDLMYMISRLAKESLILTDDRDLLQLLSDNCKVRRTMANELWDLDSFLDSRGYEDIFDFVLFKAITGDPSDNIPSSCKGVGEKSIGEFIKFLKLFMNNEKKFDFSNYPTTEADLRTFCLENEFKYKKAYLNFDKGRFFTNLELVDLNKVDLDKFVIDNIVATVSNCNSYVNYFSVVKYLSKLAIREVSADEILEKVRNRHHNLLIEG